MTTVRMTLERLRGPRIPEEELAHDRARFLLPTVLLGLAGLFMLVSIFLPYWRLTLNAPQYPDGLVVKTYVNHLTGDVREIDGLNHYIGMRSLADAAQLERSLSIYAILVFALIVIGAIFIHNRKAAYLALPAAAFPAVFIGDLYYWLRDFGTNLDPTAPITVDPFVPPILGEGKVGQFSTTAMFEAGFFLAAIGTILILAGLYYHRRAYKPLVEAGGE